MSDLRQLQEFARRYTAAWCSQNAASVAEFYAPNGSLKINGGIAAVGRNAITESAQGFMSAFPDLQVEMDELSVADEKVIFRWTLTGTNTGSGGTGKQIRISGYEVWKTNAESLIAESQGNFDEADYQRQLRKD